MRIGVLAVQGSFSLHLRMLEKIGVQPVEVRRSIELESIDGIILPGGESTTFQIVMGIDDLGERLRRAIQAGLPTWGTCAGAIILGYNRQDRVQGWKLIDIEVLRNAYGRQVDSFVAPLKIKSFDTGFNGVFIRAPVFRNPGRTVEIFATLEGDPVMARQGNILITSFHPELTSDSRAHEYFLHDVCHGSSREGIKSA